MRASVAENKCDDLAAMCQLLLSPGPVQDRMEAGAAGCGAALPSLFPIEVYTEAGDPGPGLDPSTRAAQDGRPSHPLPGLQSPPPQFTLPQINLPQNLPLVSNKPFTNFSVKNQNSLARAHGPPCLRLQRVLLAGAREEAGCAADEEMTAADPGTMFSMLAGELEAAAGLYCLGRDMRNTTSLSLLYTSLLWLGSAASAAL